MPLNSLNFENKSTLHAPYKGYKITKINKKKLNHVLVSGFDNLYTQLVLLKHIFIVTF